MQITPPIALHALASAFEAEGERLYLVGGSVRNLLLGFVQGDLDITGALPQERVLALCKARDIPCTVMSTALGTLHIRVGGEIAEYTPFRGEGYAEGGAHRPAWVRFGVDMKADALRRDFTVNALYADALTGEILDPLGGCRDLEERLLRQCAADTLCSDALRLLRLVRFSGELGFSIEAETLASARANVPLLKDIAPERRFAELKKILLCDTKYGGMQVEIRGKETPPLPADESQAVLGSLLLLETIGAWEWLIPALTAGRGRTQRADFHRYTVLEHAFHAAACAPAELTLRFSALLHDIGKPSCFDETGRYHRHAAYGEPLAAEALAALRAPKALTQRVSALVGAHMFDIQRTAKEKTLRAAFATWGREMTAQLIALREADIRGCGTDMAFVAARWRDLYQTMLCDGTPFSERDLCLDGKQLMEAAGIPAGEALGRLRRTLFLHCAKRPRDNTPPRLLRLAKAEAERMRMQTNRKNAGRTLNI